MSGTFFTHTAHELMLAKGIDVDLKRTITALIVFTMLMCMVTVSASTPGTTEDPLITRSYLEGAFAQSLRADISGRLGVVSAVADARLNELFTNYVRYDFARGFRPVSLTDGDMILLTAGSSFILLSGTAVISVTSGEVINISSGSAVATGSQLTLYQRYFCTEETSARIIADATLTGQVDGRYYISLQNPPEPPLPFIDVSESDWYYAAVEFVYREGLYQGTSANTFSPTVPMTRGMFVTVLHRVDRLPATGQGGMFSDVTDPSQYYYNAVTWANTTGIVTGYPDGTFRPDDSITREQMAVTMYRYAAYKGRDMTMNSAIFNTFPDRGNVSGYAVDALRWATTWRIINGSDGYIVPLGTATRAEVAQIILNYINRIGR